MFTIRSRSVKKDEENQSEQAVKELKVVYVHPVTRQIFFAHRRLDLAPLAETLSYAIIIVRSQVLADFTQRCSKTQNHDDSFFFKIT